MDIQRALKETVSYRHSAQGLLLILLPTAILALVPVARLSAGATLLFYLVSILLSLILGGAALFYVYHLTEGRTTSLSSAVRHGAMRFLPLLGANLLTYLLVVSGLFLLVLPGLYIAIRLAFVSCAAVLDDDSPIEALSRSWTLTSRRFWKLLWAFVVLILLAIPVAIAVGIVATLAVVISPAVGAVVAALLNGAAALSISAFAVTYTVVLYRQLPQQPVSREAAFQTFGD